ncbi:hypothetical protein NUW58_g1191 [Xylaria curta]|uniref:Uncharacterized protein n=1 Tax=Xylaria curta TaxID=42375 RepID=A0ACC1PNF1_9PEZI|nr:hypothetical protein NUW58_g1191 [Xylaria curta]
MSIQIFYLSLLRLLVGPTLIPPERQDNPYRQSKHPIFTMQFPIALLAASSMFFSGISAAPTNLTTATLIKSEMLEISPGLTGGSPTSYTNSCFGIIYLLAQWPPNVWLQARCPDKHGNKRYTILNLNHCIVNDNGIMRPRSDGIFGPTCRHNYWKLSDSQTMSVKCDGPNGIVESSLQLGDFIDNDDGQLRCFDHRGCTPHSPGCTDMPPFPW